MMNIRIHEENANALLCGKSLPTGSVGLAWLGQAGFLLKYAKLSMLIDPYLSDSLAEKYRGKEFAHQRMMPAPLKPEEIHDIDAVFCTHRHSDHMDPGTLPALAQGNPLCRFVVPRAEAESALRIGLPEDRIVTLDAGESLALASDVLATAIPSAHETLAVNDRGEHHYLGYILRCGGAVIYHSGDCVPYEGLAEKLAQEQIDLALLPINGRDEFRRNRGVPGNMTFDEAVCLCRDAAISMLVPHHFGMFAFNTVDPQTLVCKSNADCPLVMVPSIRSWFEVTATAIRSR